MRIESVCGVCGASVDTSAYPFEPPCGHDARKMAARQVPEPPVQGPLQQVFGIVRIDSSGYRPERRQVTGERGRPWRGTERQAHETATRLLRNAGRFVAFEVLPVEP